MDGLAKLPALFAELDAINLDLVGDYITVARALGPVKGDALQRLLYAALRKAVEFDTQEWNVAVASDFATLIREGVRNPSRCARLSAG